MNPLAWLIGLVLPACAATGANGVTPPPPFDLAHLQRPTSPNTALAAPPDAGLRSDAPAPTFPVPAAQLWAEVNRLAAAQPRTYALATDPAAMQSDWVVRSAVLNFPDIVTVKVAASTPPASAPNASAPTASTPTASTLAIYSRSVYGHSDFGVNRARVRAWLAALEAAIPPISAPAAGRPSTER